MPNHDALCWSTPPGLGISPSLIRYQLLNIFLVRVDRSPLSLLCATILSGLNLWVSEFICISAPLFQKDAGFFWSPSLPLALTIFLPFLTRRCLSLSPKPNVLTVRPWSRAVLQVSWEPERNASWVKRGG